ncbi:MAG: ATP-binding protein [Candidatus Thermoplasmatota archaeon]
MAEFEQTITMRRSDSGEGKLLNRAWGFHRVIDMNDSSTQMLIPLLAGGEDTLVEFKSFLPKNEETKHKVAEAATELANAAALCGHPKAFLLLGVTDDGKVVGVKCQERYKKEFRELISAKSNPHVRVLEIHEIGTTSLSTDIKSEPCGEAVYVLEIAPALDGPIRYYRSKDSNGVLLTRDGPRKRDMTNEELRRLSSGPARTPKLSLRLLNDEEHEVECLVLRPKFLVKKKTEEPKPYTPTPQQTAWLEQLKRQPNMQQVMIQQALSTKRLLEMTETWKPFLTQVERIPAPNTFPTHFALSNTGSAPAEDVRVTMKFPECFMIEEKSEYEPQSYGILAHVPSVTPPFSGVWKKDRDDRNCVTAGIRVQKLSNDVTITRFDPIFVTVPNAEREYSIEIRITADYQEPVHQTLTMIIKPIIEEVS